MTNWPFHSNCVRLVAQQLQLICCRQKISGKIDTTNFKHLRMHSHIRFCNNPDHVWHMLRWWLPDVWMPYKPWYCDKCSQCFLEWACDRYRSYWRRWWPTTTSTKTMWCNSSDWYSLAVARVSERWQDSHLTLERNTRDRKKKNRQALKLSALDSFLV